MALDAVCSMLVDCFLNQIRSLGLPQAVQFIGQQS